VASGFISAYVTNKEKPLLKHSLRSTLKPQIAPPGSQDSKGGTFLYMIKGDEGLYDYHLFKAKDAEAVSFGLFLYSHHASNFIFLPQRLYFGIRIAFYIGYIGYIV
jgi:hypothetical protein